MESDKLWIVKSIPIPVKTVKLAVPNSTNVTGRTPPPDLNSISGGKFCRTGTQFIQFSS